MQYLVDEAAALKRQGHGRWGPTMGGGKCRGHRATGYCERGGALLFAQCGVIHRDSAAPCQVCRTFCFDHGVTLWTR